MSLAIDMNAVTNVLLADGWHTVDFTDDKGVSTFCMNAYEYLDSEDFFYLSAQNRDTTRAWTLHGGMEPLVPATGFSFMEGERLVSGPITAILAVKEDPEVSERIREREEAEVASWRTTTPMSYQEERENRR